MNFAFFSFLINLEFDLVSFRVLAFDFAYNSKKLRIQTNCLFLSLDSTQSRICELVYVQIMIGVSFAHDIVEGKGLSFFTIYFVNLIILFVVFCSNNTAYGNESVELIATPNTFRLKIGTNSIAKEFKLIRWSCLSRFLDCKTSIVVSLNLINTEWVLEIERERFILEGVSDMKLPVALLCKLEDPIFKVSTISVFHGLWNFG